jgi:predicted MFS family arabinose efflux permease
MADKPSTIIAGVLLSIVGVFGLMTMPLTAGALVEHLGYTAGQAGQVAALEIAGAALASIFAVFWIGRVNWRLAAIAAVTAVIAGNLLSLTQTEFAVLATLRFLTGFLGMGTAFAVVIAVISGTTQPDRNFAFTIAGQVAFSVIGLLLLPYVIGSFGYPGLLAPLAALGVLLLLPMRWIPERASVDLVADQSEADGSILPALIGLLVLLIWSTGLGAVWTFAQLIAQAGGLTDIQAGQALAFSTGLAISGALVAAALGDKYGRVLPVTVALSVQALMIMNLTGQMSWIVFAMIAAVFQIFWNLTAPYLMGLVVISDAAGKVSMLIPAAQTGGFFVGPAIAGSLMSGASLLPANYVGTVCCLIALALFLLLALRLKLAPTTG